VVVDLDRRAVDERQERAAPLTGENVKKAAMASRKALRRRIS
jgi:hypothetical protein